MTYLYERLGHERFQQLCQALLVKDYPDLQCFPVGQPDGGRDGVSRDGSGDGEMTVVQVKFRRSDEEPSADWMIKALEGELPKIEKLVSRGAKRYIMTTNASSSAHLDAGSHDRVEAWLTAHVSVPAEVYWRDELDRRLDGASSNLKLSFPSILTGDDALTLIIAAQMGPARERITRTLRAFVSEQFRKDEEVKFRQVDLSNSLLNLFVDVPVNVGPLLYSDESRHMPPEATAALTALVAERQNDTSALRSYDEAGFWYTSTTNAADTLLDARVQDSIPWIILQGAPGQGKSTIAQYVCQVHRARFLEKTDFVAGITERHSNGPFRLPLKVDLRDLASYLDGQPYLNSENLDANGVKSLERFLASLVSIQSGGREFTPDDFAETASSTPVLLFLDGLDEVANLKSRKALVEAVLQGLNRLRDDEVDIQVVVTTRPSLFGKRVGFGSIFRRLELAPIGPATVSAYCEKWMAARRLDDERSNEVRQILLQKLDQPHIRELTRNPMQLAILLNLILSVGHSLPDARTSLYTEYVNLFMNRESEKSDVVREHRPVISAIVEYLAWMLQSAAESTRGTGSIGEDALREVVVSYLDRNKLDTTIADEVFENGIERVWVLVQRVEGLFEFEVQPLREYFAAKHLYATAPTIHFRHDEGGGDRSERFEAMVQNPYWSNVARFYAGFYQPGEIAGLGLSLGELAQSPEPAVRFLARTTAIELLADWIFNLKVTVQEGAVDLAFDSVGLNLAVIDSSSHQQTSLPPACGRDRVASILSSKITETDASFSVLPLAYILKRNGGEARTDEFTRWISASVGVERTRRLNVSMRSGALARGAEALQLMVEDDPVAAELRKRTRIMCAAAPQLMNDSPDLAQLAIENILDGGGFRAFPDHAVARLATALAGDMVGPARVASADAADGSEALLSEELRSFLDWHEATVGGTYRHGVSQLVLEDLVERARAAIGDRWSIYRLAVANAGAFTLPGKRVDVGEIEDSNTPLFRRAVLARAYRGSTRWWKTSVASARSREDALLFVAILLSWAPSVHVSDNLDFIAAFIGKLEEDEKVKLLGALQSASDTRDLRGGKARKYVDATAVADPWTAYLLTVAFGSGQVAHLAPGVRDDDRIKRITDERAAFDLWAQFPGWKGLKPRETAKWLEVLHRIHLSVVYPARLHERRETVVTVDVAERIVKSAMQYPPETGRLAYQTIMERYRPEPVGDIARKARWALE